MNSKASIMESENMDSSSASGSASSNLAHANRRMLLQQQQQALQLPPGFRFHPTDEELIIHYLQKKVASLPLPISIIADINLYRFDPWELPAKAIFGEQEWFFFSPRNRKYPNGARPNRAATSGYWKATGTDKPIVASGSSGQVVGVKKALVFYKGKPQKGVKTNWIMHEFRLADDGGSPSSRASHRKTPLQLDDLVLCRIYLKSSKNNDNCETSLRGSEHRALAGCKARQSHGLPMYVNDELLTFEGLLSTATADHGANALVSLPAQTKRRLTGALFSGANSSQGDGGATIPALCMATPFPFNNLLEEATAAAALQPSDQIRLQPDGACQNIKGNNLAPDDINNSMSDSCGGNSKGEAVSWYIRALREGINKSCSFPAYHQNDLSM